MDSGKPNGVTEPAFMKTAERFANWYREQPHVRYVGIYTDTMRRINRNMHADDSKFYVLPRNAELAAQYLLLYELSLPYGLDLNDQLNQDRSAARMIVVVDRPSTKEILELQERAIEWQKQNLPPSLFHPGASLDIMFAHIGLRNVKSMLFGTMLGLIAISITLAIAFRSVTYGLLATLSNVLPILIGFGIWGLLVGRVGMGLSAVASVAIGIVVDYTVHLLSKYRYATIVEERSAEDGLRFAFGTVGITLIATTIVLCANFSLLLGSEYLLNAHLGILTATIILFALLTDLLLLPAVIVRMADSKGRITRTEQSVT